MKERRIAIFTRISMLVLLLCIFTAVVSATSIPITSGSAQYGFAISLGDFEMEGPGLSLFQSTPQGPSTIANCEVGAVCDFSIGIGSDAEFCMYCSGMSAGTLGNKTAEFLSPSLTIWGSAFYSGGNTLTIPVNISGAIIGYELIDCQGNVGCSLGPVAFDLHISGHGIATLSIGSGCCDQNVLGMFANFNGVATVVPEPTSVLLTGSGLIAIWIKRRGPRKV